MDGGLTWDDYTGLLPLTQAGKAVAAHIEIPAAADGLELWFENNSRWGCQAWDSAYGENYRFSIE